MTTRGTVLADQATINGSTRLLAIVGNPIAHVRSPIIYNPRLLNAGQNAVLLPVHLPPTDFEQGMAGLMRISNLAGLVITAPFKERALRFADTVGNVGTQVGAINAMRRQRDGTWSGDMFDGAGLLAALKALRQSATARRVTLIGAGGAGSAIAMALAGAGAASLHVHDRIEDRALTLAERVSGFYPKCRTSSGAPSLDGCDLLINATPVGMAPNFALVPLQGSLRPDVTVIDIVPSPEVTQLLALAQATGCPTTNGQAMISGQADAVLTFMGLLKEAP
jgi:shikimate dehydrogenase